MSKKDDPKFRDSIQKLRELREELCSKQTIWDDAFQARDFVIDELQEIHEKLTQSNLKKPNFDANEAAKSTLSILKPFVSVGSEMFSLTLEFSGKEIPEILKICDQEISLK